MEYGNGEVNHLVWETNDNRYHHEESELTLDNPNVNIAVLGRQIRDNSYVLDIGCGEGKLAALLQNKKCHMYAVDIDASAIEYAKNKKRYLDAFVLDIEDLERNSEEYQRFLSLNIQFDYIVLADVLEHSINPTKVLCEMSKFLKVDGQVLISIPNVNNADIILNLLRGRFNYMQSGILDNTHTKYFTKVSFAEWINEVNELSMEYCFDCKYLGGIYGLTKHMEEVKKDMPQLFQFLQLNPEYSIIQNLFVLTKLEKPNEVPNLKTLLVQERVDLEKVLADYLKNGMTRDYIDEIGNIKLLDNEREILEARAVSAEEGWNKADAKINELYNDIEVLKKECQKLKDGWDEADKKLQKTVEGWHEADKKRQEAVAGWKQTDKLYQEAVAGWKQTDKLYQEANGKYIEVRTKYEEAMNELNEYENSNIFQIIVKKMQKEKKQ